MSSDEPPWSEVSARRRLTRLAPALPLPAGAAPELLISHSNDVWGLGDLVLRICWRGDRARLFREAQMAAALPPELGYPPVVASGFYDDIAWMLTRRIAGVTLDRAWRDPDWGRVRAIMASYAERLKALHAWTPPPPIAEALACHGAEAPTTVQAVIDADVVPLPLARSAILARHVRGLPYVDAGVADAAWARMQTLAMLDPMAAPGSGVVHCDASYPNVMVDGDRVSALLDFEWARLGPPWLELTGWTRLLEDLRAQDPGPPPVLSWLEIDYPALFEDPDLGSRLWLCELAYAFRHIAFWPPDAPEDRLDRDHPLHRIRRLIDAPIPWV